MNRFNFNKIFCTVTIFTVILIGCNKEDVKQEKAASYEFKSMESVPKSVNLRPFSFTVDGKQYNGATAVGENSIEVYIPDELTEKKFKGGPVIKKSTEGCVAAIAACIAASWWLGPASGAVCAAVAHPACAH